MATIEKGAVRTAIAARNSFDGRGAAIAHGTHDDFGMLPTQNDRFGDFRERFACMGGLLRLRHILMPVRPRRPVRRDGANVLS